MQLFVLIAVLSIMGHDALITQGIDHPIATPGVLWLLVGLHMALAVIYTLICRGGRRALGTPRVTAALRAIDIATLTYRNTVLGLYLIGLWVGTLRWGRVAIGDPILIDELLILTPPMGMILWGWWAYYPIDRRLREASLISDLDQGRPVYPIWTRAQYLIAQLRHQVALIFVPIMMLMGLSEAVDRYTPTSWFTHGHDPRPAMMIAGALGVFLIAPVIIRHLWDTTPLPAGSLRDRLLAMCQAYRVGVRQLLLWRTFGGLINGAVMGVIAPVRYILLTDALLERMPTPRVEAVMAHEIAHVVHYHMFWLLAAAAAAMAGAAGGWAIAIEIIAATHHIVVPASLAPIAQLIDQHTEWQLMITIIAAGATWFAIFGWVSRRFERQADTFAVKHLSQHPVNTPNTNAPTNTPAHTTTFDSQAITVMVQALQQVADLNHIPTRRRSWRHGCIAWRQDYLRRLVDQPTQRVPIDRQVTAIKATAAATLIALAVLRWLEPAWLEMLDTGWF